jgi:3-methyladenine DNA glycosylase AlkD
MIRSQPGAPKSAIAALVRAVRAGLRAKADPDRAPQMQAYMKSAMPYHGVAAAPMRAVCKEVFAAHPLDGADAWREAVRELWHGARFREERYAAIELLGARAYRPLRTLDALPLYEELIVSGAWWDLCDAIAPDRVGELLRAHPALMKETLLGWARGDDMWKRRSAIISQLRFKEHTDLAFLTACIEPSIESKEFFLRKAIGWALRQYAWTHPDAVVDYVRANEERLSGLSKREALKNVAGASGPARSPRRSSPRERS